MLFLITYDVATVDREGERRLNRIAKACIDYGQRVQNSVFECDVDYATFLTLRNKLLKLYDPEQDSLRIYRLGNRGAEKVEHYGKKDGYDPKGLLLV